jgi:hypothetical protein
LFFIYLALLSFYPPTAPRTQDWQKRGCSELSVKKKPVMRGIHAMLQLGDSQGLNQVIRLFALGNKPHFRGRIPGGGPALINVCKFA